MPTPEVALATPADRDRVVSSLVAAFVKDPVLRYLFPEEQTYPEYAAAFFGLLFDKRVGKGTIWTIEGGASTAIWEPPAGDGAPVAGPTADGLSGSLPAGPLGRLRAYDEVVHDAMPQPPYWYLGVLGTDPGYAGRGWGRVVMGAGLRRAVSEGLPAVLETSNPGNVEVYRRAGFEVVRALPEPVPVWIMRR